MSYHYTYLITANNPTDEKCHYVGVRSCKVWPTEDVYFGSSRYFNAWQKQHGTKGLDKKILAIWPTKQLAYEHEIRIHQELNVASDPTFWNRANQNSAYFAPNGQKSAETRKKLSDSLKGRCCWDVNPMLGKKHSEETKRKMSEARTGKKLNKKMTPEKRKNLGDIARGRIWVNNGDVSMMVRKGDIPDGFVLGRGATYKRADQL